MKEVIERCNWLVNKCEDKAITPDVKDDVRYLLEEIERLNKENKLLQDMDKILRNENTNLKLEIERLNNIINDIIKDIEVIEQIDSIDTIKMNLRTIIYKIKGVDKE